MTWKAYLTKAERERLDRLERIRDESATAYRAERRLLKSRAESRMRQEAKRDILGHNVTRQALYRRFGTPERPR